jgi:hypothetical protein
LTLFGEVDSDARPLTGARHLCVKPFTRPAVCCSLRQIFHIAADISTTPDPRARSAYQGRGASHITRWASRRATQSISSPVGSHPAFRSRRQNSKAASTNSSGALSLGHHCGQLSMITQLSIYIDKFLRFVDARKRRGTGHRPRQDHVCTPPPALIDARRSRLDNVGL